MGNSSFKVKINLITRCDWEKVKYFPELGRNHPLEDSYNQEGKRDIGF